MNEIEEAAIHNYEVAEIVFNWLLENGLIEEDDIGPEDDNTPEAAAMVYINVYKKLLKKENKLNIHEVAKSGRPFRNPDMIGAWIILDRHFLIHRDNVRDFKDMDWIYENCISNVDKKSDKPVDLYWMTVDDLLRNDWEIVNGF